MSSFSQCTTLMLNGLLPWSTLFKSNESLQLPVICLSSAFWGYDGTINTKVEFHYEVRPSVTHSDHEFEFEFEFWLDGFGKQLRIKLKLKV